VRMATSTEKDPDEQALVHAVSNQVVLGLELLDTLLHVFANTHIMPRSYSGYVRVLATSTPSERCLIPSEWAVMDEVGWVLGRIRVLVIGEGAGTHRVGEKVT
jgi:hypothetical protein